MRPLSPDFPDFAQALSLVAHTLGDLWTLYARLAATAAGEAPSPRRSPSPDSEARPEPTALVEEALQVANELARLRDRLSRLAPPSPPPAAQADEPEPDLPLDHAAIQYVLADHLEPAVDALAGLRSEDFELARVTLDCILADRLLPAMDSLSLVLLLHEEGSAHAYLR